MCINLIACNPKMNKPSACVSCCEVARGKIGWHQPEGPGADCREEQRGQRNHMEKEPKLEFK